MPGSPSKVIAVPAGRQGGVPGNSTAPRTKGSGNTLPTNSVWCPKIFEIFADWLEEPVQIPQYSFHQGLRTYHVATTCAVTSYGILDISHTSSRTGSALKLFSPPKNCREKPSV